jgi:hypothetical protein
MPNVVAIVGDTCTLHLVLEPLDPADPALEFSQGSFHGTVDERRACTVRLAIPDVSAEFTLRLEFTSPQFATVDIKGKPLYQHNPDITPYEEHDDPTMEESHRGG